jgi:hypothetical protein
MAMVEVAEGEGVRPLPGSAIMVAAVRDVNG